MVSLLQGLDVSRETMDRLKVYSALLEKWTKKINLVSRSTIPDLWSRHIVDSAQVFHVKQTPTTHWLDIGSGAGLPGMICAILAKEFQPECKFTLIESDLRKSTFLRTANRELGLKVNVISERVEEADPVLCDVMSARALADLGQLLSFADHHLGLDGIALLPKGATWQSEIKLAQAEWRFSWEAHRSVTNPESTILEIGGINRV